MASSVKEHRKLFISSVKLALELLKFCPDPKLTAADSSVVLALMKPGADFKWLECAWLFVLRYCLGACPTSVSIKSIRRQS